MNEMSVFCGLFPHNFVDSEGICEGGKYQVVVLYRTSQTTQMFTEHFFHIESAIWRGYCRVHISQQKKVQYEEHIKRETKGAEEVEDLAVVLVGVLEEAKTIACRQGYFFGWWLHTDTLTFRRRAMEQHSGRRKKSC